MVVEAMVVCGKVSCSGDVLRRYRKNTRELEQFGNRH